MAEVREMRQGVLGWRVWGRASTVATTRRQEDGRERGWGELSLQRRWTSRGDAQRAAAARSTYSMRGRHSSSKSDSLQLLRVFGFRVPV